MNKDELLKIKKHACEGKAVEPIDIVFLTFNRLKYFVETIQGLIQNTRYPYRIIIVDNNSDADFKTFLKSNSELFDEIIFNDKNEKTSAFQKGIDITKSDPFIVSDPDIIVPNLEGKCWLERVLDLHKKHDDIGLIALNLDDVNKPAKLPDVYVSEKEVYNNDITLSSVGTVFQTIKRKFYNFNYNTDWDACERIRRNGGKVGFVNNIKAYHIGWNEEKDYPEYLVEKYKYWKEHYGVDTYEMYINDTTLLKEVKTIADGYYQNTRPEIQEMVNPNSKRILDVGCAAGNLGYELRKGLNAEVWGIEIVEEVAEKAKLKLNNVIVLPVEKAILLLPDKYFDTIILADVLEHLVNPGEVLMQIKQKLNENGEIIISIPNVLHFTVAIEYLSGGWEYKNAGILDKTHLRFFTRTSLERMIDETGYKQIIAKYSFLDYKFEYSDMFFESLKQMNIDYTKFKNESSIYQFIYKIIKKENEMVSVVIPFFNQAENTLVTVYSIMQTTNKPLEIVLVDDGSSEEEYNQIYNLLHKQNSIKIIRNDKNYGFPYSVNRGILETSGKYVFIANNDIIVTEGAIDRMVEVSELKNCGMVGCITNKVSGIQIDSTADYIDLEEMRAHAKEIKKLNHLEVLEFPRVAFFFTLIKRNVIDKLGGLDERFSPGNFEDDDYCLRSLFAGFKTIIAKDVFVHHYGSTSFLDEGKEKYWNLLEINKQKFIEKWGVDAEEMWKTGKKPRLRTGLYNISKDKSMQYLLRALDHIEFQEYDLALDNLQKVCEIAELNKIDEINGIKFDKIKELMLNIKNNLKK